MKTDDEVRGDFKEAFDVIDDLNGESSPHLRVVFDDKRCADCGEEGDPRLMYRYIICSPQPGNGRGRERDGIAMREGCGKGAGIHLQFPHSRYLLFSIDFNNFK